MDSNNNHVSEQQYFSAANESKYPGFTTDTYFD